MCPWDTDAPALQSIGEQEVDGRQVRKVLTRYNSPSQTYIPNIKSFCCIEAEKSVKKIFGTYGRTDVRTDIGES